MGFLQVKQKEHSYGKEICYACDTCDKPFIRNYKKRLLTSKLGFFCSVKCGAEYRTEIGITHANLHSKVSRKKSQKTWANKTSDEIATISAKIRNTYQRKYGVDNISQLPDIKKKKEKTVLQNYGVKHQWSSPQIRKQIHEKMKANGSYCGISKPQKAFGEMLETEFGSKNVKSSIIVNGWEIDFYIKSTKTYVQFDGVYWHGLDRSLKEIRQSNKQRDHAILKTVKRDRLQNTWFKNNGHELVRITDKQFKLHKKGSVECLLST